MPHQRILVVDDDPSVLGLLRRGLMLAGYEPLLVENGERALVAVRDSAPDLVILDVMLPGVDGLEVCRLVRKAGPEPPVLLLTARNRIVDRVAGLDAGADDFLAKPFALDELLARIRALLRRGQGENQSGPAGILRFADLTVNPRTREVWRGARLITLTAREFALLELFMQRPREVISRPMIVEAIWGSSAPGDSNTIEVNVKRLRRKLEAGGAPRLLHTLRGVGYSLREGERGVA